MIICNCNAISDKTIKQAAEAGNRTIKSCFNYAGKKPNCGRCFQSINNVIEKNKDQYCKKVDKSVA